MALMGKIRGMHFRDGKSISEIARLTSLSRRRSRSGSSAAGRSRGTRGATGPSSRRSWRRNLNRFPPDFMFQHDADEFAVLRLQSATSKSGRGQHRKYLLAFTEHGAIMAATLLNSPRATAISVYVVRAFVELRGMLANNRELAAKVERLKRKVSTHECHIAELVDSMAGLLAAPLSPPKRSIGFVPLEEKKNPKRAAGSSRPARTTKPPEHLALAAGCGWLLL
jgi:ORF6N domain